MQNHLTPTDIDAFEHATRPADAPLTGCYFGTNCFFTH